MRIFVLATILLASSSLSPSFAQQEGKAPVAAPQAGASAQPDQNQQPRDQRTDRDQPKADAPEMGRGGMMRRGDDERMGRDCREMGPHWRMHRDREAGGDRDMDRRRYSERGDRDWERSDGNRVGRGSFDEDRPRRRVKICVEYENGDEYCRYRE